MTDERTPAVSKEHAATEITVAYFYLIARGMMYKTYLFHGFGVSVFDYAEIDDYLFAAAEIWPGIIIAFFLYLILKGLAKGIPLLFKYFKGPVSFARPLVSFSNAMLLFAITVVLILSGLIRADIKSRSIRAVDKRVIGAETVYDLQNVVFVILEQQAESVPPEQPMRIIGRVSGIIAFYELSRGTTILIPEEKIITIQHKEEHEIRRIK
jgi:hypothetical protein